MATVEQASAVRGGADAAGEALVHGKYLSLTSFRRDGTPVATPLWFVEEGGRLYVVTAAGSWKAKRIRRNPAVTVARCTARGALRGDPIAARAEFLPEEEHAHVDRLMARKYRIDRVLVLPIYRLAMRLAGRAASVSGPGAYLAITPVAHAEGGPPPS
jgi:PPOX class probable F420-dependent enzyme